MSLSVCSRVLFVSIDYLETAYFMYMLDIKLHLVECKLNKYLYLHHLEQYVIITGKQVY